MARGFAQIYNGTTDSGGVCPCVTPPTVVANPGATARTVRINSLPPILETDTMPPATGVTCTTPTSACTSPRQVIVGAGTVRINGLVPAVVGNKLNVTTNITLMPSSQSANVMVG